jgi:hypothetical protein
MTSAILECLCFTRGSGSIAKATLETSGVFEHELYNDIIQTRRTHLDLRSINLWRTKRWYLNHDSLNAAYADSTVPRNMPKHQKSF